MQTAGSMRSLAEARLAPAIVDCCLHGEGGVLNVAGARVPLVLKSGRVSELPGDCRVDREEQSHAC
jgi:hypothetical protein